MSSARIVPGSWWFGRGWLPWPTSSTAGVTVGAGLTLLANPDGPRSLGSADGTLGGLVLPPALACDAGALWLLDRGAAVLRRFDPVAGRFVTVAGWGGGSSGAQRFGPGTSIAATGGRLALVDTERGDLVVVAAGPMAVQAVLGVRGRRVLAVAGPGPWAASSACPGPAAFRKGPGTVSSWTTRVSSASSTPGPPGCSRSLPRAGRRSSVPPTRCGRGSQGRR